MSRKLKKEFISILCVLFATLSLGGISQGETRIRTGQKIIVIDPGHGGMETGSVSPTGIPEKAIMLKLSLLVKAILEKNQTVFLTRGDDVFLSLKERTSMANNKKAHLFISLHAMGNSAPSSQASFFYFTPLWDHSPPLEDSVITWEMEQIRHVNQSKKITDIFCKKYNQHWPETRCTIMGAPLTVLAGATMPAVLIEPFSMASFSASGNEPMLETHSKVIAAAILNYLNDSSSFD